MEEELHAELRDVFRSYALLYEKTTLYNDASPAHEKSKRD